MLVICRVTVLVVASSLLVNLISNPRLKDWFPVTHEVFEANSTVIVSYTVGPVEVDMALVVDSVVVHSV